MYLSSGSKNVFDVPSAATVIDLAVRGGGDVQAALRRRRDRVHFELRRVEERGDLAVAGDLQDLAFVAAAGPQRAVGAGDDRPQERRGGLAEHRRGRAEEHAAVAVDGQVLDVAFEEIGLRRRPSRTSASRQRARHQARQAKEQRNASWRRARASVMSGYRASRSIVSIREPVTAASAGISHSPSAALRIGVKLTAVAIRFEHREHRRRERRHRFAVDHGAGAAGHQPHVDAVVAARLVEHAHHLGDRLRLQRAARARAVPWRSAGGRR